MIPKFNNTLNNTQIKQLRLINFSNNFFDMTHCRVYHCIGTVYRVYTIGTGNPDREYETIVCIRVKIKKTTLNCFGTSKKNIKFHCYRVSRFEILINLNILETLKNM